MNIVDQVIRSYRSFTRKHAFNMRFEMMDQSEERIENQTLDLAKESMSTKDNSSPKERRNRCKSQLSVATNSIPERIITVKPIDGRKMLESIKETKESEQRLISMRNRIEKLMKEKRKALSNIKYAKDRSVFINRVNELKDNDFNQKEKYRELMRHKLEVQREQCAKQRRELTHGIHYSKNSKIEENREKKNFELQMKQIKKKEKQDNHLMIDSKNKKLKESVSNHRKQKTEKLDKIKTFANDMSQIRYHFKQEHLSSTKKAHLEEIELLQQKEQEILEKLQNTLKRQEEIERETNSPIKIRRAPSLTMEAKFAMLKSKFHNNLKLGETNNKLDNFGLSSINASSQITRTEKETPLYKHEDEVNL